MGDEAGKARQRFWLGKKGLKRKKKKRETKRICLHYTTGLGTLNRGLLRCAPPMLTARPPAAALACAPKPSTRRKRFQGCFAIGSSPSASFIFFLTLYINTFLPHTQSQEGHSCTVPHRHSLNNRVQTQVAGSPQSLRAPSGKSFSEAPSDLKRGVWEGGCLFRLVSLHKVPAVPQRFKVPREQPGLAHTPLTSQPIRPWGRAMAPGCLGPVAQGAAEHACPVEAAWAHGCRAGLPTPQGRVRPCRRDGWCVGCGDFPPHQDQQTRHPSKAQTGLGCSPAPGAPILGWHHPRPWLAVWADCCPWRTRQEEPQG